MSLNYKAHDINHDFIASIFTFFYINLREKWREIV